MSSLKKQIRISTNLSNVDLALYNDYGLVYNNSIVCKYTGSNNDKLINQAFTKFIDNIYFNNHYTSVSDLINYKSKTTFEVIYNISTKLRTLDDTIFNPCPTLYSISNLSTDIKKIGQYAFNGCVNLRYVVLPSSVKEIEEFAFNGTPNLYTLDVSKVTTLHNYTFAGCGIKTIVLNDTIDTINPFLFKDCINLKKFVNNNIKNIGEGAFNGCSSLEYIEISSYEKGFENEEYVETSENNILPDIKVGEEYTFTVYDYLSGEKVGKITVKTVENTSNEDPYRQYVKFVVLTSTVNADGEIVLVEEEYYVHPDILVDTNNNLFEIFNIDEMMNIHYKIGVDDGESGGGDEPQEDKPVENYILYDKRFEIGQIDKNLADKIKAYDETHHIIDECIDNKMGTETITLNYRLTFVEYYKDGQTPTGKTYNNPQDLRNNDQIQGIPIYKYYYEVESEDEESFNKEQMLIDTDDINDCMIFNEDFTEGHIKYNCIPVYNPEGVGNEETILYYMFDPFFGIRVEHDENFIPKPDTNEGAYIDNGYYISTIIVSGNETIAYPIYNKNFCCIGILNEGQYTDMLSEELQQAYFSALEMHSCGNDLFFFTLPSQYHYTSYDLSSEESINNVISEIEELIAELEAYKNPSENVEPEDEEEIPIYSKYSLSNLKYSGEKYNLPDFIFSGCVKLSNNKIVRNGNYDNDPELSNVEIIFKSEKNNNGVNIGEWKDNVHLINYTPSDITYRYDFTWKLISNMDKEFVLIVLNGKNLYIKEVFENDIYKRDLIDNIYNENNSTIYDRIISDQLDVNISLFDELKNLSGTKTIDTTLPEYQEYIYDKYELLDSINKIGDASFMNCLSLKNIYNSFEEIGNYAFKDCINLNSIDLRKTNKIGHYALQNCTSLTEANLMRLNETSSLGIFYGCTNLQTVDNFNLAIVKKQMFKNCESLESIQLNNTEEIESEAFFNCYNLSLNNSNNINNIKSIGSSAFYNCRSILSLVFNNEIEFIGESAFKYCTSLTSVILPNTISNFSKDMFYGCSNLKTLEFKSAISDPIDLSGIDYCNKLEKITIKSTGRYSTPNNNCIFDKTEKNIVYVCKNISVIEIESETFGNNIGISDNAFNNSQVSIIKIDDNVNINNVNHNTFKNIKNNNYHILINKEHPQYRTFYELVGKRHIYYV